MNKLLTVKEVAKILGVGLETMYELCRSGFCPPSVMVGNRRRFRESSVDAWVKKMEGNLVEENGEQKEQVVFRQKQPYSYKNAPVGLINVEEFAELIGVCTRTIWRLSKNKDNPQPARIGRSMMWRKKDVDAWIEKKQQEYEGDC